MVDLAMFFFFFFQAEDGIRDVAVTGVQTCALPIYSLFVRFSRGHVDQTETPRLTTLPSGFGSGTNFNYPIDRKSTRLNSSHGYISYAVFCLKKKKTHKRRCMRPSRCPSLPTHQHLGYI